MINNQREFEQARERDLDRAVDEHYSENEECEGCGMVIDVEHGVEIFQGNDNQPLCEDCAENQEEIL